MFSIQDILLSLALTLGFAVCTLLAALVWKYCRTRHQLRHHKHP